MSKRFEALSRDHDRKKFDCGVPELNLFLRESARKQQTTGISRTFVLVDAEAIAPKPILGFYTLVAAQIDSSRLTSQQAKRLPNKAPCVLLARLAVSKAEQGQGLGKAILAEAIIRTLDISEKLGVAGLFVEAKDDQAARFYERFGFERLPSDPLKLFQSLKSLRAAM